MTIALNELWTGIAALATILLGVRINRWVPVLAEYSIPPAVTGGLLIAILLAVIGGIAGFKVTFGDTLRNALLLIFFASLGLTAKFRRSVAWRWSGGIAVRADRGPRHRAVGDRRRHRECVRASRGAGGLPGQRALSRGSRHHGRVGRGRAGRQPAARARNWHGLRDVRARVRGDRLRDCRDAPRRTCGPCAGPGVSRRSSPSPTGRKVRSTRIAGSPCCSGSH